MASKKELEIHHLWWSGYNRLSDARHHSAGYSQHFTNFHDKGLDDETIAAAFSVPVEDVTHDIEIYTEAIALMKHSNELAAKWVAENGPSSLLEGYDE